MSVLRLARGEPLLQLVKRAVIATAAAKNIFFIFYKDIF